MNSWRRGGICIPLGAWGTLRIPVSTISIATVFVLAVVVFVHTLGAELIHVVRPGDTLSKIAGEYGTSIAAISDANGIRDPRTLKIGQRLRIPQPGAASTTSLAPTSTTHTVQAGDTIYGISRKYGVSVQELLNANDLSSSSILRIGQRLQIPGGGRGARGAGETRRDETTTTPSPTPLPEATPTPTSAPTVQSRPLEHRVVSGDTLSAIAARYGVSASAIAAANRIQVNSILRIGQVLRIPVDESVARELSIPPTPSPRTVVVSTPAPQSAEPITEHVVRPGEGLQEIADLYGLDVADLREWNNIRPGQFLRVGQVIRLTPPDTQTASTPQRTAQPNTSQSASGGLSGRSATGAAATQATASSATSTRSQPQQQRAGAQQSFIYIRPVKAEIDRPRIRRGRWRYVVIHHSETKSGNAKIFDRYHRNVKRWENGLAYHFVIGNGRGSGDGEIEVGQRWRDQLHGGHLRSQALNEISIGICLVGSYNVERPTSRQIAATIELVEYLRRLCGSPRLEFTIHRNINPTPTDCPGKLFPERSMFQRLR